MYSKCMQSYSINIFDDIGNGASNGTSNGISNGTSNGTKELDFRPTSTSQSANEFLPLQNDQRFQQNALLNGKTKYEEENTIIKSLEEEIVSMKHKLSFVYEKDEEIGKLKEELHSLKKEKVELQSLSEDAIRLRLENKQLQDQLQSQIDTVNTLQTENKILKDISTNDTDKINHEIDEIDELMDVNIPRLRNILLNRLKDKQTEHIENLIHTYGLKNTNKVKKSVMEKMLEEAIHL